MENKTAPYQIRLNVLQLAEQIVLNESGGGSSNGTFQPGSRYSTNAVLETAEKLYGFVSRDSKTTRN